jgi:DNA-binding NtrC family response regulator
MAKVLIVDDELTLIQAVGELLRGEGHEVLPFTNARAALDAIPTVSPDLVVAHLVRDRTRTAAAELLQKARGITPPALVIMLTAEAMGTALEAMRHGAYDYLQKPFTPEELKLRVQRALAYQDAVFENVSLRKQLQSNSHFQDIVAVSPRIQELLPLLDRAANSDCPVLLLGPTGSGKEFIARTLHFHSRRRFAPFLTLSCDSVPGHLLESELFGERKTIFHTSIEEKIGVLREANGGTVFLRQIGALPLALQSRLLGLLEGRPWEDAGTDNVGVVDVRVIAAAVQARDVDPQTGKFMLRLHERFAGGTLTLPSLRERAEDMPVLISHFLRERVRTRQGRAYSISPEALEICTRYSWPGNVRELQVALEHACAVNQGGTIQISDLPRALQQLRSPASNGTAPNTSRELREPAPAPASSGALQDSLAQAQSRIGSSELVPLKKFLRDQEINYLQRTLAEVGGSKERAAELLGISLATIYRKLSEPSGPSGSDSAMAHDLDETVAGAVPAV